MRLSIEHHTLYRFSEPQARLVQMLRLAPRDTLHQTVVDWRIDVSCDARLRAGSDGFGNETTMLFAEGPLDCIEITVMGEVLCTRGNGVVEGVEETLSPLVYRRSTPFTHAGPQAVAFAEEVTKDETETLGRLWALCRGLAARFSTQMRRTGATVAEAMFAEPAHSPRDLAQMFVACARALDIPARFVSGYALAAAEREGTPGPHGWAEAHVEGLGWVGFDPSRGQSPDETYVRVAIGLDAAGAAPIAGARIGHGEEELDVDLQVGRLGGEE